MTTGFEKIQDGIFCYPKFGENLAKLDSDEEKISLAVFNLFGTLLWGENGTLINYDKIVLSSPFCKENLKILQDKGFVICVIEYIPESKLSKFVNTIDTFYMTVQNKVSIHFFAYTNKEYNIKEGLIKYFKPLHDKFGKKSFYCGDNIGKDESFPWFRYSDSDKKLAESLNFKFYNPIQILGKYQEDIYVPNTLYITCGQKYSGYEMEFESFRKEKIIQGILFRVLEKDSYEVYGILADDLLKELVRFPTKQIIFEKSMTVVIFGSNPTYLEREFLRNKFINYTFKIVMWYSRPNYKNIENETYTKIFENPLLHGEMFLRSN
jgi:hypothetical protein